MGFVLGVSAAILHILLNHCCCGLQGNTSLTEVNCFPYHCLGRRLEINNIFYLCSLPNLCALVSAQFSVRAFTAFRIV